jgi:Tol biopolymer transport system component
MTRHLAVAAVAAIVFVPVVAAQAPPTNRLKLEQFFDMESVSNPRLSPDGTQIVYTRGVVDKVNDRRQSDLWIMNADGTRSRFLTEGSNAEWSPDGTRLAFTRTGQPRGTQVWVRWMDAEGATTQITRVEENPGSITWTPDGKSILFTMTSSAPVSWPIKMPARPEGARWTEAPRIIESLNYRADRRGFVDPSRTHIFSVPAEGGTPRQLTQGPHDYSSFSLTPDGKEVVFSANRDEDRDRALRQYRQSEVYAMNLETGALRQLTTRSGPDTSPVISPDGRWVAYLGYDYTTDTYIDNELYVVGINGQGTRHMTPSFDRSPSDLTWAPDSTGI